MGLQLKAFSRKLYMLKLMIKIYTSVDTLKIFVSILFWEQNIPKFPRLQLSQTTNSKYFRDYSIMHLAIFDIFDDFLLIIQVNSLEWKQYLFGY